MKFKVWIASSLCGALLLTMLAGCGSGAGTNISQETTPANNGEEQDEVYVLRAGHVLNEEGAYTQYFWEFSWQHEKGPM